ncbi:SapB/AmfS family lanthipeptide [Streptomyces sp. NPDC006386]|uniref:SapB/AmfS family lanthipeptide n=1 Tax=Streptomyces sp. NPDC006386 TaxID=3156762 RepID=UPI0033BC690C
MTTDGHPTEGHTMALLDLQTIESEERTDGGGASPWTAPCAGRPWRPRGPPSGR